MNYEIIKHQPVNGVEVILLKYTMPRNSTKRGLGQLRELYYATYAINAETLTASIEKMWANKKWFGRDEETGKLTENLQKLSEAQIRFDDLVKALQSSTVENGIIKFNPAMIKQPVVLEKPENLYGKDYKKLIPAIQEAIQTGKVNTMGFSADDAKLLNDIAKLKQDSDFLKLL